ncbi:hypothetical protein Enr13x_66010 [Stieleria neptunia]|uniref:Uncharacterized protein n=1 Tax=Stieleria neptunia TaxID=2527979 RepID=A0A518I0R5_9BACT|nr:hypothetical protein [Stieleria neptunia]QDV46692.1 hypothetical protein Enr13x_66010 [Stieleria neptunia]
MSRDSYRSVGAIVGLGLGIGLMLMAGQGGVLPGAIFGAGGAMAGGILGEKIHAMRQGK